MFKNFMRIFSPKYFTRLSHEIFATLVPTNVVQVSYDGRATVLRKHANTLRLSGEKIKLSNIRTNVVRHAHECLTTVVRMKISYIRGIVAIYSQECRATVLRLSRDSSEIYFQN